jgi:hypothetical protein
MCDCHEKNVCTKTVLVQPKVVLKHSEPLRIPRFPGIIADVFNFGLTESHLCSHAKGKVKKVRVENITGTHSAFRELRFVLIKDDVRVVLVRGLECETVPAGVDDFSFGFADDGLDRTAAFCNLPSGPVGDGKVWKPHNGEFSNFEGLDVEGIWTLRIWDFVPENSGELQSWKFVIELEH